MGYGTLVDLFFIICHPSSYVPLHFVQITFITIGEKHASNLVDKIVLRYQSI